MANIDPLKVPETLDQTRERINRQFKELDTDIKSHKQSNQAHDSKDITYSGNVPASNVKQAIDQTKQDIQAVDSRVSTILAHNGDGKKDSELIDARKGAAVLGDRLNAFDEQLADMAKLTNTEATLAYGPELLDGTGWTSAGWTGDFATGFTHVVGQSTPLTRAIPGSVGKLYKVELTLSPTCVIDNGQSDFWISIGGSPIFETYRGYAASRTYIYGIRAIDDSGLIITPWSGYEGIITNISVKEITGSLKPKQTLKNESNQNVLEVRTGLAALESTFIGKDAGKYSGIGDWNTAVGVRAMEQNVSGFWNQAFGVDALRRNVTGSRNVAIGFVALRDNVSGDRNIAVGTFALHRNISGRNNIGIGADAIWYCTTGSYNIGLGMSVMARLETGERNIAMGQSSLYSCFAGIRNVAIGDYAGHMVNGEENIALGNRALFYTAIGDRNVAIGARAMYNAKNASNNVVLGASAAITLETGDNNILINADVPAANTSNYMQIATVLYSNLATRQVGIGTSVTAGARVSLPGGNASYVPLKFNNGSLSSAMVLGGLEYDGTDLYLTNHAGVRKKIAFVA